MEKTGQGSAADGCMEKKWYQDVALEDAETFILANMKTAVRSVIAIGYYLKCIRDGRLYLEAGYGTVWEYAKETFGFSKSTASRYMSRNDRFSVDGNSPVIAEEFREYSRAQLQEMLSLDEGQLEQVTPDMTVSQIREMKRPPKEIPYYDIPGQMSIADFPGITGEDIQKAVELSPVAEAAPASPSFVMAPGDFFPEEDGTQASVPGMAIATPQQEAGIGTKAPSAYGQVSQPAEETTGDDNRENPEEPAQAKDYDRGILEGMLHEEQEVFDAMADYWRENQPWTYSEHRMKLDAYRLLLERNGENQEPGRPEQPDLPLMKNNDKRREFIRNFSTWPVWFKVPEASEVYYRYDFEDGSSFVICEYACYSEWKARYGYSESPDTSGTREYLLMPGYHYLHDCRSNETAMVEHLKKLQKR